MVRGLRNPLLGVAALAVAAAVAVSGCATKSAEPGSPGGSSPASSGAAPAVPVLGTVGRINLDGQRFDAPTPPNPADPAGNGKARCRGLAVAILGDLTGPDGAHGAAVARGAQLALDRHNATNPDCRLDLRRADTTGNTVVAVEAAKRLVADPAVIAVIGPFTSSDAFATGPVFHQAGLAALSPSATAPTLTDKNWRTFFRGVNNDDVQGQAIARYLVGAGGRTKVCVIADDAEAGAGLSRAVTQGLGGDAAKGCSATVRRGDQAYGPQIQAVVRDGADAVFFAGSARDAGSFAAALHKAAPQVQFAAGDEATGPDFAVRAGQSAVGALVSCSCGPDPREFAADFTQRFGAPPARYSLEAYDLATVVVLGIRAEQQNRRALRDFVATYAGDGLSRHYAWAPTGELIGNTVWLYRLGA